MKRKGIVFLISVVFLLSGCAGMDLLLTAGTAALTAVDVKGAMKSVDYRGTIKAEFDQVWEAALATTEEMGIKIAKKTLNKEKNGGIITGKTGTHQKIQIIVATTTPTITSIGIKARKREMFNMPISAADVDIPFASMIFNGITKGCQGIT